MQRWLVVNRFNDKLLPPIEPFLIVIWLKLQNMLDPLLGWGMPQIPWIVLLSSLLLYFQYKHLQLKKIYMFKNCPFCNVTAHN